MKTLIICILITLLFLSVLYIWGKAFLTAIKAKTLISDCVLYGFIVIHIVFQIFYLPFLLTRGSFYVLSIIWLMFAGLFTACLIIYLAKKNNLTERRPKNPPNYDIVLIIVIVFIVFLCIYIGGRPRYKGLDTFQYIYQMNEMVFRGTLWNEGSDLQIHQGLNSYYTLYAIISWATGIKPVFLNHLTMRFVGVVLFSLVSFRFGRITFRDKGSICPLVISIIAPLMMMLWNSKYSGAFFYARTNESKGICFLFLFPLAVSIFIEMMNEKKDSQQDRNIMWIEEITIGLSAVPIAVSSMSIYPVIVFMGMVSVIAFDKFKRMHKTILYSSLCVIPNITYIVFYLLYQQRIIRF